MQSKPSGSVEALVGKQVESLRKVAKLTQKQLAQKMTNGGLPVDASAVSRIEKGQRALRLSEAVTLAEVLEVDLNFLTMHEGTPVEVFRNEHSYAEMVRTRAATEVGEWLTSLGNAIHHAYSDPDLLTMLPPEAQGSARAYVEWLSDRMRKDPDLAWSMPVSDWEGYVPGFDAMLREAGQAFIDATIDAVYGMGMLKVKDDSEDSSDG